MTVPVAWHNFPKRLFPISIWFVDPATGRLVWSAFLEDRPGILRVPSIHDIDGAEGRPPCVIIIYGDGDIIAFNPDGTPMKRSGR